QRNQSAAFSSGKVRPNHETNINIIARRTGKDVNSHTVLDGIITTIMATIQRINIIGSREGSRNRRRLKANQTGKKFRVVFPFIQEPPSGDLQERVLIRHHDYDQCFQSVQLLQWNSQVKFNVTVYRNLPTTRDSIMTS